jgi:hypothetical protein
MSYQPPQRESDASIASAIQEITEKTQLLVKDEIELAKSELEVKVKALARGAAIGAAAGIFVLAALLMLLHGFAWLSYYFLPVGDLAFFWGFFFVAGLFLVAAAVAGYFAARFFKQGAPPKPQMAIDEGKRIQQTVNEARAAEAKR